MVTTKIKTTKTKTADWRQYALNVATWFGTTSLPEVLFVSTFVLSRYYANIDFSYPVNVVGPLLMMGAMASVVYYIFRMFLNRLAAHLASLPAIYLLYSFQQFAGKYDPIVNALLPGSLETPFAKALVAFILTLLLCGVIGWFGSKLFRSKKLSGLQLSKVMLFVVAFLFLSELAKVGVKLVQIMPELAYQHSASVPAKDTSKPTSKPDIYYLVFDRYGNNTTMQREYNYDNSYFTDFLADKGFVTRKDAYANYPFTISSISSTLAMDYHTKLQQKFGNDGYQTAFPYRDILNNPPVAKILQREGYSYNQVSSWSDYTRLVNKEDSNPTKSFRLSTLGYHYFPDDLGRDIINKSILSPLLKKGITVGNKSIVKYDLDRNPYENFEAQMTALKTIAKHKDSQPQFSFAHVLVPHDPYIFNADGSPTTYDTARTDNGADETVKYTNQLTYLNKRIQDLITNIRQDSPNAVIIIQADEGPYPKQFRFELSPDHYYNPIDLDHDKMQQKLGVMASYYMPGVDAETVSKNIVASVDPFRFVLSHYLGYEYEMLPDCNFAAGDKYSLYHYQLITDKLKGTPAPEACNKL